MIKTDNKTGFNLEKVVKGPMKSFPKLYSSLPGQFVRLPGYFLHVTYDFVDQS